MSNTRETAEDSDDVSPPKQARDTSFQSAFSNLKKSKFFNEQLPTPRPESSTATTSSRTNAVLVSQKQKGNPLLKFITNVPWEYSDIVPDYVMGNTTCALFLSIRYHQLNPDYIHERLKLLSNAYNLRVLLVQIDVADPHHALKHLTRISILADMTIMLAWSAEDAGKIIETYKRYETKPPDDIMERSDTAPHQKLVSALTTVRSVNKTDASTLLTTFGTLADIVKAQSNTLAFCPGFGLHKAQKLHKVLHEPFLRTSKPTK
ncbi:DNA excision repair protein ERCC-1 isoform X1 [Linepithema humile]|uniref:DNA excision repair protein ERCC-1 isoform X1 n=1 Tax=Linepithema humile TaxID=83485 RepID=UPI0006238ACF|nr:PREDICTED: DNA excision repair protein ERCC-1 [Linepithema humile]XP_012224395.1 PREDICTED: DNA excision repair protein ERCC-1 [Linepithema humile]